MRGWTRARRRRRAFLAAVRAELRAERDRISPV
jgi:hypothetical protein